MQVEKPVEFFTWPSLPPSERPSDATGRYFVSAHHVNVAALKLSAAVGRAVVATATATDDEREEAGEAGEAGEEEKEEDEAALLRAALQALVHIGLVVGSAHRYHDGPVEMRWYPHPPKLRAGHRSRELFVVVRTGLRDIKASLAFVEYDWADADAVLSLLL